MRRAAGPATLPRQTGHQQGTLRGVAVLRSGPCMCVACVSLVRVEMAGGSSRTPLRRHATRSARKPSGLSASSRRSVPLTRCSTTSRHARSRRAQGRGPTRVAALRAPCRPRARDASSESHSAVMPLPPPTMCSLPRPHVRLRAPPQVMDARSAGRFVGTEPEPRPGLRGGHIPGPRSHPAPPPAPTHRKP